VFRDAGHERIYSELLAEATGTTAAQVRKDFSLFGLTGNKRGGYRVEGLLHELDQLFGLDRTQRVVIAGAGRIGKALAHYAGFAQSGFHVVAIFDIDPAKVDERAAIPVLPLDRMAPFVADNDVRLGILAVPGPAAQQVFDMMREAGIAGVLNFASTPLKTIDGCEVDNVHIASELESIVYYVNRLRD
jgi:redox-sensing transcriptional repressor